MSPLRVPGSVVITLAMIYGCTLESAPPRPPQVPAPTGIYGSGIAADDKDNMQLSGRRLAHRFRASTSSGLVSVRVQQRGGPVYSAGTGGVVEVSLRPDDGSRRHRPADEVLASVTVRPGNPEGHWTTYEAWMFPEPVSLTAGELYHIVFENLDPAPEDNYVSVNELFVWESDPVDGRRQPALYDDYAVLYDQGEGWELEDLRTADMDLVYADGSHDGQGYIDNMCDRYGVISGPDQMVRERFTVSGGDRSVGAVSIRLKRTSGPDPLTIHLEHEDGTLIESHEVPADLVATAEPACIDGGGSTWVTVEYEAPVLLEEGSTYDLRLTTDRQSQYTAEPIREGTIEGLESYRFTDGEAERSTDGGATWSALYPWAPVDLQFYFRPAA
jgi:hypothetical protein